MNTSSSIAQGLQSTRHTVNSSQTLTRQMVNSSPVTFRQL